MPPLALNTLRLLDGQVLGLSSSNHILKDHANYQARTSNLVALFTLNWNSHSTSSDQLGFDQGQSAEWRELNCSVLRGAEWRSNPLTPSPAHALPSMCSNMPFISTENLKFVFIIDSPILLLSAYSNQLLVQ